SKCLCENDNGTVSISREIGREFGCGINIQDIVPGAREAGNAVRLCPGRKWTGLVLVKCSPQRNLIVLKDVNRRYAKNGSHIHAFMEGRGLGRSVSDPS